MEQDKFGQSAENEAAMSENIEVDENTTTDNLADDDDNVAESSIDEAEEWRERYIRLSAEFDNYRKRTMREKLDLITSGGEQVIRTLLPVVDDFGRALDAIEKSDDIEQLKQGITLISNKLNEALRSQGVIEIEALGQELDTDLHDAVARFAAGEENRGKIIDIAQKGYKMGDKVIRHAKVVVGE